MKKILIVEDDPAILLGLEKNLRFEGYQVITALEGETGLRLAVDSLPDLAILDIMLPKINGFEICRILRTRGVSLPVIFLSAKGQEIDKIKGFELGADDYITKPFSVRELLARVKAVLRRKRIHEQKQGSFKFGIVEINFDAQLVTCGKKPIDISKREYKLLTYMIENEGRVLDRTTILNKVWGFNYEGTARTIDNFINRLRQKIESNPEEPKHIQTVFGVGYRFVS
ncbi:MAG: response regulator transcription factor [Planctomycetota bacterium]